MPSERVLICGAGVSGSVLAFWLAKHDFQVVVIERSKAGQKAGQGIEIEQPAFNVVKLMGILDKLEARRTTEAGFILNDKNYRSYAQFEAGRLGPTGALELMRGDLTEVLYQAADESANVTYRFETTVQSLRQTSNKVFVDLEDRTTRTTTTEEFDFVIGADGVKSRTRQLVMGSPEQLDCLKSVGALVAYFSIPKEDKDSAYSTLCHFPNRRIVWLRPMGKGSDMISVYLIHCRDDVPDLREAIATGDRLKQKEALARLYSGLGWETPRVIEQMMKADNFYADDLAQVKLQTWSQNRVVLVGDSAWAPTPFTGQGNQLAIIGAWVLAQEMSRDRSPMAFQTYEKRFRPYVEESQKIPLGGRAPYLCNPETSLGIWIFRMVICVIASAIRFASWIGLAALVPQRGEDHPFDLDLDKAQANLVR